MPSSRDWVRPADWPWQWQEPPREHEQTGKSEDIWVLTRNVPLSMSESEGPKYVMLLLKLFGKLSGDGSFQRICVSYVESIPFLPRWNISLSSLLKVVNQEILHETASGGLQRDWKHMDLLWETCQSQRGQVWETLVTVFRFFNMITFPYMMCTLDSQKQYTYYNKHFLFEKVMFCNICSGSYDNLGERFRTW